MLHRSIAGLAVMVMAVACGASPSTAISGPTAASVAVQPRDVPASMQKCQVSGDIDSFLNKSKAKDPSTYTSFKSYWDAAQKSGATAEYTAFYADSNPHCTSLESNSAATSSATYDLVVNLVVEFKDEASAKNSYANESIFGISQSSLKNGGAAVQGTATGLTPNSIVLSVAAPSQAFYIAFWQNKAFVVALIILNLDSTTGKKVALAENSRIK